MSQDSPSHPEFEKDGSPSLSPPTAACHSIPAHDSYQAQPTASSSGPSLPTPEDRYERRLVLGEGGMGRVTLVHDRLLGREIALKEAVPGRSGDALHLEASLTARLEHPAVVPVYDALRTPDGRFAYTMRLLRGRSLDRVLAQAELDSATRRGLLRHLLVASQAVAWAHTHGIVHRDLKPANIMIGEFGETQVVDWGLAQSLASETTPSGVSGTPHYMSPEQAAGRPAGARSDVYALGLVLYEVVTGRRGRPHEATEDVLASAREGVGPARDEAIPGDLWAVIRRATARVPSERYADAKAFADDLAAWLDGRRVSVHEYSPLELLSRLVAAWRIPLLVALVALVIGGIAVGLSLSEAASQRDLARAERELAEAARTTANEARREAEAELARSLVFSAGARLDAGQPFEALEASLDALTLLERDPHDPQTLARARGIVLASASSPPATILGAMPLPDHERWIPGTSPSNGLAVFDDRLTWWDLTSREPRWSISTSEVFGQADQDIEWALVLPTRVVVGSGGHLPFAIDFETGLPQATLPLPVRGGLLAREDDLLVVGWDSMTLMVGANLPRTERSSCREQMGTFDAHRMVSLCRDGHYFVWRRGPGLELTPEAELLLQAGSEPSSVALRSLYRELVVGTTRGELLLVELGTGALRARLEVGEGVVSQLEVSDDGRFAALLDEREGVALIDLVTRTALGRLPASVSSGFRFEAGATLSSWGADRLIRWELSSPGPRSLNAGEGVTAVGWGPGGTAYTASRRQALHALDGTPIDTLDTPHVVKSLAFLPLAGACDRPFGPAHLATAGVDFRLRLTGPAPFATLNEPRAATSAPMVRRLAAVRTAARGSCEWMALALTDDGALTLFDASGAPIWERPHEVRGLDLAVSDDGRLAVASLGAAMQPMVFTIDPAPEVHEVPLIRGCRAVAVAPSAERLFACAQEREISVADLDGHLLEWLPINEARAPTDHVAAREQLTELSWSPDGRLIAAGTRLGRTLIWSAPGRERRAEVLAILSDHRERVAALAWDPTSRWLISGSWDRMIRPRDSGLLELPAAALRQRLSGLLAYGVRP